MRSFVKLKIKSWWFPWFFSGLVLRFAFMATTLHSDLWAIVFGQYFLAFKGVGNFYDFLFNLPADHALSRNYGQNFYTYPPLTYFVLGGFMWLLKPFYNAQFLQQLPVNLPEILNHNLLFRHLFLFKLPYLFFDLAAAVVLYKLFSRPRRRKLALILWLLNPIALYTSFMIGQFDIVPVFLVVLSLYLVTKGKKEWAAIALGTGGAFKLFPLLFLPPLVLVLGKSLNERIKLSILGIAPYFLAIMPFLSSVAFRQIVLLSNQSQKMLFMRLALSGAEGIIIFVFLYVLVCLFTLYTKIEKANLWKIYFAILLLLFSVTHYHPQWFLWLTPFMIIELVKNNFVNRWLHLILFACFVLITLYFESSLHIGLFAPIFPALANLSGGLADVEHLFLDPFLFKSIVRSIFAAIAFYLVYFNFRHEVH